MNTSIMKKVFQQFKTSNMKPQKSTTKPSHRVIAMFFVLTFVNTLIPYNQLWANNNGPNAPEAAAFEPVDATDMVNLVTGDMSYVLPLLNVPSPEGGYPLALSYHAGIAMNQEASWVGLGWSLNPGAINRSVNGYADDLKESNNFNLVYSDLGSQEIIKIGAGALYKGFSIGLDATFIDGKATGGSVNFGYGNENIKARGSVGIGSDKGYSIGITAQGQSLSLGSNGATANIGYMGAGVNYSISNSGESSFEPSINAKIRSVGINVSRSSIGLSEKNGASIGLNFNSRITDGNLTTFRKGFTAFIPAKYFYLKFSIYKQSYSIFDNDNFDVSGSLYSKYGVDLSSDGNNIVKDNKFMDSYSINLVPFQGEASFKTEPHFLNYDNYSVSGQGILSSISPMQFEYGDIIGPGNPRKRYHFGDSFAKSIGESSSNKIYFYTKGANNSYLEVNSSGWGNPPSSISKVTDYSSEELLDSTLGIDQQSNYNSLIKRKGDSNFIEVFTNDQIKKNSTLIFEANNFNRNEFPIDGIGAYKITTPDGKTYHYSLPVYHYEQFVRIYDKSKGEDISFFEKQQLSPYATHWLLTGVTGSDYIDVNNNGILDKSDYGYWASFDYGKWTDSYLWTKEVDGSLERNIRIDRFKNEKVRNTKFYGIKQVYYLNAINTRTHSALFLKSINDESKINSVSKSLSLPDINKEIINDGKHATGVYFTDLDYFYDMNINSSKSLKLENIILIKEKDKNKFNLNHTNSPTNNLRSNKIDLKTIGEKFNIIGQYLGRTTTQLHSRTWNSGEYSNNVYLKSDYTNSLINENAINNIELIYGLTKGEPSIKKIYFKNKGGRSILPGYEFDYYNRSYNTNELDLWGYNKNVPYAWSLRNIKTPIGTNINIEYERDDFRNTLFDENKYQTSQIIPIPKSFVGSNNNLSGELELIWNHPCSEIDETYGCLSKGDNIKVKFIRTGFPDKIINGSVNYIYNKKLNVNFSEQVPNHFSGDFYNNPGGRNNPGSKYYADLILPDCDTSQLIGKCNDSRGGIRVKSINIVTDIESFKTEYSYDNVQGYSSGFVTYTPYKDYTDLGNLISAPYVMYKNVKVSTHDNSGHTIASTNYVFNVPTPLGKKLNFNPRVGQGSSFSFEWEVDNFLKIEATRSLSKLRINDSPTPNDSYITLYQSKIKNNLNKIGSIKEKKTFNSLKQVLSSEDFTYSDPYSIKAGLNTEAFKTYSSDHESNTYMSNVGTNKSFFDINHVSISFFPNNLEKTTVRDKLFSYSTFNTKYDFNSGQLLETITSLGDGTEIKSKIIPAYTKYSNMGSKVDNPTNKNMLTQTAANLTQIKIGNDWKTIGADITTWNNNWTYRNPNGTTTTPSNHAHKIWRKHQTYAWKGDVDARGVYVGYTSDLDGFVWGSTQSNPKWINTSTINLYDHYSMPLETEDINGNSVATKMGDNHSKVIAVCNARYTEMFYSGGEYWTTQNNTTYLDGEIKTLGTLLTQVPNIHTGNYLVRASNANAFEVTFPANPDRLEAQFKVSLWVRKGQENNLSMLRKVGNHFPFAKEFETNEKITAGGWVMLNGYIDIPAEETKLEIYSNGTSDLDDFRIHPIESSMTSYVYNEWDELTHIIAPNNLATRYEYDDAGRLEKTFVEVIDAPGVTGGFKLQKKVDYTYKKAVELDTDGDGVLDPIEVYDPLQLTVKSETGIRTLRITALPRGGSGRYRYNWKNQGWTTDHKFDYNDDNPPINCGILTVNVGVEDIETKATVFKDYQFDVLCKPEGL